MAKGLAHMIDSLSVSPPARNAHTTEACGGGSGGPLTCMCLLVLC